MRGTEEWDKRIKQRRRYIQSGHINFYAIEKMSLHGPARNNFVAVRSSRKSVQSQIMKYDERREGIKEKEE